MYPPSPPRLPQFCVHAHTQGGAVPEQIRICTAENGIVWVPILFVLKGIFLLSGVFLAVQTWNIKLKSINDSQLIAVAIVAVFFATVVAAMVAFFLRDMVDLAYGVTAACGIVVGYLLLCLLYLKKVRPWSLGLAAILLLHRCNHILSLSVGCNNNTLFFPPHLTSPQQINTCCMSAPSRDA